MKDMQFWMDGHTFRDLQKNPETKNMLEQIDAHGGNVRWAPAPETLKDITRKITAPAVAEALRQRTMGPD
jgi:hypothetical protein